MTPAPGSARTAVVGLVAALALATVLAYGLAGVVDPTAASPSGVAGIGAAAPASPSGPAEPPPAAVEPDPAARVDPRLLPEDAAALERLSASAPGPLSAAELAAVGSHQHGPDPSAPPPPTSTLGPELAAAWAAAEDAALALATPEAARAAGYQPVSPVVAGVGAHWVRWSLVDAPFDPARPSMLLFATTTEGRPPRLVGFSYWVRSPTPPEGFPGDGDVWHRHAGLCFQRGWLLRERVPSAAECPGTWLHGGDLWMLHAWVVPDVASPDGRFAPRNTRLCPRPGSVADAVSCDPVGS